MRHNNRCLYVSIVVVFTLSILFNGCSRLEMIGSMGLEIKSGVAEVNIAVTPNSPFSRIARIAIASVSAGDMTTISASLTITATSVQGTISNIPAGKARMFQVYVYDSLEVLQYSGSATADVIGGATVPVSIRLVRILGNAIINGTIDEGGFSLTPGLVAYYPFNGNAIDESGNGNNGTVYGAALTADRNAQNNQAYLFDGNDTIGVASKTMLNFGTGDFSICFWMKGIFGNDYMVMGKSNGGIPNLLSSSVLSCPGWNIQVENTQVHGWGIRLDMWDGANGGYDIVSSTSAVDGRWHFVVFTVDRDAIATLYVDGVKKDEGSVSSIGNLSNTEPFRIGKRPDWSSWYTGSLDQVRLYNRVISTSEIAQLYIEAL